MAASLLKKNVIHLCRAIPLINYRVRTRFYFVLSFENFLERRRSLSPTSYKCHLSRDVTSKRRRLSFFVSAAPLNDGSHKVITINEGWAYLLTEQKAMVHEVGRHWWCLRRTTRRWRPHISGGELSVSVDYACLEKKSKSFSANYDWAFWN